MRLITIIIITSILILLCGTKIELTSNTSVPPHIVKYPLQATFTAYTLSIDETDSGPEIGASGDNLKDLQVKGVKVCASRDLPLHTLLDIKGYGTCEVLDRTSKKYAGRIDILFPDRKSALNFGIKKIDYKIIK